MYGRAFRRPARVVIVVLSSAKIGVSSWRYYTDATACAATKYYLGAGEAPGHWHGRGLSELGLTADAQVSEQQLEALFSRGLHPATGKQLGRAWRTDAVTGYDLTFSAPKSVSALWALGSEPIAAQAMAAHHAAVQAGLGYLDRHAGLSRRGTDGAEQIDTSGVVAALFDHRTSRAGDPQLHTHALVLNKVRCTDGVWRTLDGTEVFGHKKTAGMIYQSALRHELHRRLGVEFTPVSPDGQAEITGVPNGLLKLWSKRTTAISAEATPRIAEYERALGRTLSPAERIAVTKTAVLKTRPGKTHPEPTTLHATWTSEAAGLGWTPDRLMAAAGVGQPAPAPTSCPDREAAVLAALRATGRRAAVFARTDLAGQLAAHLPVTGLSATEVLAQVEALTDAALASPEAVPVGQPVRGKTPRASDPRFATIEILQAEARILNLAARGRAGGYGRADDTHLQAALTHGRLDAGQAQALLHLAGGGDFLRVLTAPAGAGKTSTLGATSQAWTAAGFRVIGLAPSARAAAELATATGLRTDTLAKWLHNYSRLHQLPTSERAWSALDDRTVLLVDEASMASTLDLDRLTTLAATTAAKVVLVGDPAQIGVINGPGGMLAALTHAGHGVQLEQIHRFTEPWERTASLQLRAGNPSILGIYHAHNRLHPCPSGDTALDAVFAHWAQARADGHDALMLARTRLDVAALNDRARATAVSTGQVTGPITVAGDRAWQAGDLLRTRRNNRALTVGNSHVRNGDRYLVLGPAAAGGLVAQDLTGRGTVTLPTAYLAEHCEYGWASTIDAAQGATTDLGIVLVRPGLDREHLYVAMTRGRLGNHAYLTADPSQDLDHPPRGGPHPSGQPEHQSAQVLVQALRQSGAQDAAHTALATARQLALQQTRRDQRTLTATGAAEFPIATPAEVQPAAPPPLPAQHTQTAELLVQLRDDHAGLLQTQDGLRRAVEEGRQGLATCPRWSRRRRRDLTAKLATAQLQLTDAHPQLTRLEQQIHQTGRLLELDTQQRPADEQPGQQGRHVPGSVVSTAPPESRDLARPRHPQPPASVPGAPSDRAVEPRPWPAPQAQPGTDLNASGLRR